MSGLFFSAGGDGDDDEGDGDEADELEHFHSGVFGSHCFWFVTAAAGPVSLVNFSAEYVVSHLSPF